MPGLQTEQQTENADSPESRTPSGKTEDRQTDRPSVFKALYKDSLCSVFCFVLRAFLFMHNFFEKVLFFVCFGIVHLFRSGLPCISTDTQWQRKTRHGCRVLGCLAHRALCLPLKTKGPQELSEGFCQDLTFGYRKITRPLDSNVNSHSFQSFHHHLLYHTAKHLQYDKCNTFLHFLILSVCLRSKGVGGELYMDRSFCQSSCILQLSPLDTTLPVPVLLFLLRHSVNLLSHAHSANFPLSNFGSSESTTPGRKGFQH